MSAMTLEAMLYAYVYCDVRAIRSFFHVFRYVGGDTNTSGGLWQMLDKVFTDKNPGDRPNVPNIGIVITGMRLCKSYLPSHFKPQSSTFLVTILKKRNLASVHDKMDTLLFIF